MVFPLLRIFSHGSPFPVRCLGAWPAARQTLGSRDEAASAGAFGWTERPRKLGAKRECPQVIVGNRSCRKVGFFRFCRSDGGRLEAENRRKAGASEKV